jgi:hypothetical protein
MAPVHRFLLMVAVVLDSSECSSRPIGDCLGGIATLVAPGAGGSHPLTVTPALNGMYAVDFGTVALGQTATGVLLLKNPSCGPLQVLSVGAPSDAEFSLTLQAGSIVPPGGSVDAGITVPVSFKPFSTGQKSGSLVIHTDSSSTLTVTVVFEGTGVDAG